MSNRPSRQRSRTAHKVETQGENRSLMWIFGIVGVVAVGALIIAVVMGSTSDEGDFDYGVVRVSGQPLETLTDTATDSAVGLPAPEAFGSDFDGEAVSIENDGRPKVLTFLAHWCGHCQVEAPVIQDWVDTNGMPDDVDLISVLTLIDPPREEWPPDEWLESVGWTLPVLVDDEPSTAGEIFGLSGTPFWMAIDAGGNVVARTSGEIGTAGLEALIDAARSGSTDTGAAAAEAS